MKVVAFFPYLLNARDYDGQQLGPARTEDGNKAVSTKYNCVWES